MFRLKIPLIFASLIILIGCGGGSSEAGGGQAVVPPIAAPTTKIVAIGDSIGTGFGIATPWPTLLANQLGVAVINNSVSGEQTDYGVGVITGAIDAEQPTHVVILLGTNDAIRGSVSGAIANLQQMVDIANSKNVTAIVATLPIITRSGTENARAGQISAGIRGLAGAQIADIRGLLDSSDIADGVHPNQAGQDKIADALVRLF